MPHRKQYKIPARQTAIYKTVISELQKNPALTDYDMETIEISVKKKIPALVRDKIAKEVKVTVNVNYEPYKK